RIPWAQNRLDIHIIESSIAGRPPQKAEQTKQPPPFPTTFISAASVSASRPETPVVPISSDPSSERQSIRASSPPSQPLEERRDSFVDIGGDVVEHNTTPLLPPSSLSSPPLSLPLPPPLSSPTPPPPLSLPLPPSSPLAPSDSNDQAREQEHMSPSTSNQGFDKRIEPNHSGDQTNATHGPESEQPLPLLEPSPPLLLLPPSPLSSAAPQLGEQHDELQDHRVKDSDKPA
ncbi:hypothetical protein GGI05_004029, partial [Coemansia sp. RSA 2603]